MAGISTGPSGGFMSRLKQGLPGAINAAGSMMPGPFGQTAKIASNFMKKPQGESKTTNPMVQGKQTTQSNGPGGMPPTGPSPFTSGMTRNNNGPQFSNGLTPANNGIVRGPSMPIFGNPGMTSPMAPGGGGDMMFDPRMRNGNTGFAGGMFGNLRPQPAPLPDMPTIGGGTGLWNSYNQLTNEIGAPQRQLFY